MDQRKVEENWKEGFFFSVLVLSGCAFCWEFLFFASVLAFDWNRMDSKSLDFKS